MRDILIDLENAERFDGCTSVILKFSTAKIKNCCFKEAGNTDASFQF